MFDVCVYKGDDCTMHSGKNSRPDQQGLGLGLKQKREDEDWKFKRRNRVLSTNEYESRRIIEDPKVNSTTTKDKKKKLEVRYLFCNRRPKKAKQIDCVNVSKMSIAKVHDR